MNYLILYSADNTKGKKDATGAFIPEAKKLEIYLLEQGADFEYGNENSVDMVPIQTKGRSLKDRRDQVESVLKERRTLDHVYFLCHGYKHGIQFGYKWRSGAVKLANVLNRNSSITPNVTFYCCSVAKDRDNFAKWMFDELSCLDVLRNGVQVFGHYTAGHTTMNPCIKIYATGYKPFILSNNTPKGYNQLITTGKDEARKRMRDSSDDLRFSIPFYVETMRDNGYDWGWS